MTTALGGRAGVISRPPAALRVTGDAPAAAVPNIPPAADRA